MTKHRRISQEIAEASRASSNSARFVRSTHTDHLVQTAREIERLMAKRRKLRRELKVVEETIRARKRELKAAAQAIGRGKDEEL